jgi:TM2 domain-containing membrane protein YozV
LLLGGFGAHRFYLGQKGWGIAYLLFCWTLIPLVASWVECFSIRERSMNYNKEVKQQIMQAMNILSVQEAGYAVAARFIGGCNAQGMNLRPIPTTKGAGLGWANPAVLCPSINPLQGQDGRTL